MTTEFQEGFDKLYNELVESEESLHSTRRDVVSSISDLTELFEEKVYTEEEVSSHKEKLVGSLKQGIIAYLDAYTSVREYIAQNPVKLNVTYTLGDDRRIELSSPQFGDQEKDAHSLFSYLGLVSFMQRRGNDMYAELEKLEGRLSAGTYDTELETIKSLISINGKPVANQTECYWYGATLYLEENREVQLMAERTRFHDSGFVLSVIAYNQLGTKAVTEGFAVEHYTNALAFFDTLGESVPYLTLEKGCWVGD